MVQLWPGILADGKAQLEETPETPPSSPAERILFLHGLESNPGSSLQTEEEAVQAISSIWRPLAFLPVTLSGALACECVQGCFGAWGT